ncbi:DUF3800 domain-containing protein [Microvirga sp. VF16]|uniref:DUF3800 domain-containing protein n=1 Tax=Microvirga sp. VF16 TaxID=2807101 RepID=UPI00193D6A00|nr:DUF3800 domain-containing protein [Microvirga sp. VF16]QRM29605.1 DUF3800 domain-containing protein [Microvirga sp. VF16]
MHLIYIDDSKDNVLCCFSALCIPANHWLQALNQLIEFRRSIRKSEGIFSSIEMHATDWIGGRGNIAHNTVLKITRARIFRLFLEEIIKLPQVQIFNACGSKKDEMILFERLLNRINVNMSKSNSSCIIFSDEGKNYDKLVRRMRRHNYIISKLGTWNDGSTAKNIPIEKIIEDPVYRDSSKSLLIQASDFCAFSLLRKEAPTPNTNKLGISDAFMLLEPVLVKQAYRKDPLGIIRST